MRTNVVSDVGGKVPAKVVYGDAKQVIESVKTPGGEHLWFTVQTCLNKACPRSSDGSKTHVNEFDFEGRDLFIRTCDDCHGSFVLKKKDFDKAVAKSNGVNSASSLSSSSGEGSTSSISLGDTEDDTTDYDSRRFFSKNVRALMGLGCASLILSGVSFTTFILTDTNPEHLFLYFVLGFWALTGLLCASGCILGGVNRCNSQEGYLVDGKVMSKVQTV